MTVLKIVVEVHYIIILDYSWIYNMQIASCELVFKKQNPARYELEYAGSELGVAHLR